MSASRRVVSPHHAHRRLAWLKRLASVGGVALGALGLAAPAAGQEAQAADGAQAAPATMRPAAPRARALQPLARGDVRPATAAERAGTAARSAAVTLPSFTLIPPPAPGGLPPVPGPEARPALVDIDGDGDLDVFTGFGPSPFVPPPPPYYGAAVAFNTGSATMMAFGPQVLFGFTYPTTFPRPAFGDFDGDGDFDSIIGDAYGTVTYTENAGTAAAADFTTVPPAVLAGVPGPYAAPTVGDLDGDGDLDLVVGTATYAGGGGGLFFLLNTGGLGSPPVFDPPVPLFAPSPPGSPTYFQPALGDFDGDGDLDMVVGQAPAAPGPGTVEYYENVSGPGDAFVGFLPGVPLLPPYAPLPSPAAGDLDGDGDLDLILGDGYGGFLYFENAGNTTGELVTTLGTGGWTFIGSPDPTAMLSTLLDDPLWIQGTTTGGDTPLGTPNAYTWSESDQDFADVDDLSALASTAGLVVYVFSDDNGPDVAGDAGFPKMIDVLGPAPLVPGATGVFDTAILPGFDFSLSYTDTGTPADDGFNLLALPSASWFDWSGVELTDVGTTVYVYDPAAATYKTYDQVTGEGTSPADLTGGVIAPFQSFFVQAESAMASMEVRPSVSSGGPMRALTAGIGVMGLSLRPDAKGAGTSLPPGIGAGLTLAFGVGGALDGFDTEDAPALAPLGVPALATWTEAADEAGTWIPLSVDKRAWPSGDAEVPVGISVAGATAGEPLELTWPRIEGLPESWRIVLTDHATGTEVDLRTETSYRFTVADDDVATRAMSAAVGDAQAVPALGPLTLPSRPADARADAPRFTLRFDASAVTIGDGPATAEVSLVRPNPTSGRGVVRVAVAAPERVRVSVLDVLGREVAVAHDAVVSGTAEVAVDGSRLTPGVYVVRIIGATFAESRPLTVAR